MLELLSKVILKQSIVQRAKSPRLQKLRMWTIRPKKARTLFCSLMNFCPEVEWAGEGAQREKYKPAQVTNNKAIILTFAEKKAQFGKQKGRFQTEGHVKNLEKF